MVFIAAIVYHAEFMVNLSKIFLMTILNHTFRKVKDLKYFVKNNLWDTDISTGAKPVFIKMVW